MTLTYLPETYIALYARALAQGIDIKCSLSKYALSKLSQGYASAGTLFGISRLTDDHVEDYFNLPSSETVDMFIYLTSKGTNITHINKELTNNKG